jgi:hypothetical protein
VHQNGSAHQRKRNHRMRNPAQKRSGQRIRILACAAGDFTLSKPRRLVAVYPQSAYKLSQARDHCDQGSSAFRGLTPPAQEDRRIATTSPVCVLAPRRRQA